MIFYPVLAWVTGDPRPQWAFFTMATMIAHSSPRGNAAAHREARGRLGETIDNAARRHRSGQLPLGPDCKPVFPRQFLKISTIFEVTKNHGGARHGWISILPMIW